MKNKKLKKSENKSFVEIQTVYEKPLFKEQIGLTFPRQIWGEFNKGRFCLYCSGCHGCR